MFLVGQLRTFFEDLQAPDFTSAIAMVHSRFSTNTEPSWKRAHPNRLIVHNGEINTIRGNVDKMLAREETLHTEAFSSRDLSKVFPVIHPSGSGLCHAGQFPGISDDVRYGLPLAVMISIPEPWSHNETLRRSAATFTNTMPP